MLVMPFAMGEQHVFTKFVLQAVDVYCFDMSHKY